MNPVHLLNFSLFARLKSITKAAECLNLGQPALSGQLKQLKEAVGEPLYQRLGHQITLTRAGEGLLYYAERMAADFQAAQEYVRRLKRMNAGSLRIGATMTIASYYLPRYVVQLQSLYPGVHVTMSAGNSEEIVQRLSELDLAFIEGPVAGHGLSSQFHMHHWREDEIVLIVHRDHEIASKYPEVVPLEVFANYPVIWREPGSGARQVVEQALAAAGIVAPVHFEVMGVAGVKESVRAGLGIGFASSRAMRHENAALVSRHIAAREGLRWQLNIIVPDEKIRSRVCEAFLQLVSAEEKEGGERA